MKSSDTGDNSSYSEHHRYRKHWLLLGLAVFALLGLGFRSVEGSPGLFLVERSSSSTSELVSRRTSFPEAPELVVFSNTSLSAPTPPLTVTPQVLGAIIGSADSDVRAEITKYVTEEGDTPSSIAKRFGVSLNTVLWANDLSSSVSLKAGRELVILPVSGALHFVRPNDTLSEIASWYKASSEDIISFNGLASAREIFAGDILIIPDGTQPSSLPQGRLTPIANSYFIYPIPAPHRITQGLHPFNAIDFSNGRCGDSVYAAAGGTVQLTGYTSVGGRYVRILHPNGVVTYYGHLSSALVNPGDKVYQGQAIGYTGYTGYTIPAGPAGCHLHFEVRGATNPFAN